MSVTLTIRDETTGGLPLHEWALEVPAERMSVRELIRARVYQEVQDHHLKNNDVFRGFIQPEESEKTLNGWKFTPALRGSEPIELNAFLGFNVDTR